MADNTVINAGAGGDTIATDDIAGVKYQIVKVAFGALDTGTLVTTAAGLPADLRTLAGTAVAVNSGVVGNGTLRVVLATDVALPAGTNGIGKLTANSGVDIGDVDITSVVPGTAATNLGKAIDTALGATDTGVLAVGVRDDALAALTEADGDITPFRFTSTGRLWVDGSGVTLTVASHAVTNAGTFAVQVDGAALTSLQLIDDTVYAEDVAAQAADKGVAVLAVRRDTASTMVGADNDYTNLIVDANGKLHVNAGTLSVGDVTNAGTFAVQVSAALPAGNNNIGDVDIVSGTITTVSTVSALGTGTTGPQKAEDVASANGDMGIAVFAIRDDTLDARSGTEGDWEPFHTDANGGLWVDVAAGTLTAVTTVSTVSALGTGTTGPQKAEDVASANGDMGIAVFAIRDDTLDARSGTEGDWEPFHTNANGALWVSPVEALADDAAFTPGTSRVIPVGFEADEGSTDSVDEGDVGAARMTLDRKQIVTAQGHTAGGLSTFMASGSDGSSILVATKQTIKASAGQLYGYYAYNPEAAVTFVHIYNTDTVTVGTTNPQMTIAIPAGSAANLSLPVGISFSTAMSCAATTTAGGNTAPATGVSLVAWYM